MKDIPGFEGKYAATSCGRIWSHLTQQFLKPHISHDGYRQVMLNDRHWYKVHRLVALTYIPNPDNLNTVDHIITIKDGGTDCVNNLRWMSHSDNSARGKHKQVLCVETGIIYESGLDAANHTGINKGNIASCCTGKRKTAGGFHWQHI